MSKRFIFTNGVFLMDGQEVFGSVEEIPRRPVFTNGTTFMDGLEVFIDPTDAVSELRDDNFEFESRPSEWDRIVEAVLYHPGRLRNRCDDNDYSPAARQSLRLADDKTVVRAKKNRLRREKRNEKRWGKRMVA